MALNRIKLTLEAEKKLFEINKEWLHTGVAASGDIEILIRKKDLGGKVEFTILTPVRGFENVWEMVINKFVNENGPFNMSFEINDNNATPFVVGLRLEQAVMEAKGGMADE